jgi:hypothetical protein
MGFRDGSGGESEEKAREEIARVQMEIETSLQQLARRVDGECNREFSRRISASSTMGMECACRL